ncbi:MAG: hypothetical protein QME21_01045 [Anaerolineales bacterium]|nr:hypothetical protein [Anaerolineales bacterium]
MKKIPNARGAASLRLALAEWRWFWCDGCLPRRCRADLGLLPFLFFFLGHR